MTRQPPDDFGFEFEDEAETIESAVPRSGRVRGRRTLTSPPISRPRRLALGRLAGGVAALILLVVAIVSLVGGGGRGAADLSYLSRLSPPAADSQAAETQLAALLRAPTLTEAGLESKLASLARRQQRDAATLLAIAPPPRLRTEHTQALYSLQLRAAAVEGLLTTFRQAQGRSEATWSPRLAAQVDRLVASDVLWRDRFVSPTDVQLTRDGVATRTAPRSSILAIGDLASSEAIANVLRALRKGTPAAHSPLLERGSQGPAVVAVQKRLNAWLSTQAGRRALAVTGTFDPATTAATIAFQRAHGLGGDGVVGPATRRALGGLGG
jgi:hypothetical protein